MSLAETQEVLDTRAFSVRSNSLSQRQLHSILKQPTLLTSGFGRLFARSSVDGADAAITLDLEGLSSHEYGPLA